MPPISIIHIAKQRLQIPVYNVALSAGKCSPPYETTFYIQYRMKSIAKIFFIHTKTHRAREIRR